MKKAIYKTNINCGGCIATVTPFIEKSARIEKWSVDTASKHKLLTVEGADLDKDEVVELVKAAGFEITEKKKLFSF